MTTTVFLVRHGSTDHLGHVISGRMDGVALNDAGRREAAAAAGRLRHERIEALYTSPLQRTRETAAAIGEALRLEPRAEDGLLEIDFGDWTGARFADLDGDPVWRRWNDERSAARAPRGETMAEVQERLVRWVETVRARHPQGRICAVSHADVIKALLAHVLGFSLDRHDAIEVGPGSVSVLCAGDWGMKVLSVNEACR
ncbi:histidine phosphatase family protein [Phenylobacterium sp.]|uniref:histidine phosphatase family protein n=1 Tax=Phenylobacterium sp. TaxID=1871053 RepID=UPI002BD30984|nr:histidine phosphatase family protein [Phenylobacterium sp.]HVI30629.1 histidine phosphatase family protein [Phenylobacterium sp.]